MLWLKICSSVLKRSDNNLDFSVALNATLSWLSKAPLNRQECSRYLLTSRAELGLRLVYHASIRVAAYL